MVLGPVEFARLKNFVPRDVYDDLQRARALNPLLDNELRETKRQLECDKIDDTYKTLLLCLLTKVETGEGRKKRIDKEAVNEHDTESKAEKENDPQYEFCLKHMKEHDTSYALEYEKDSSPVVIKYEADKDSDRESDQEPRRATRAMKRKNQMPSVENWTKHRHESNLVKKSKGATRRRLRNEADQVDRAKDLAKDVVPDHEDLHIQRQVELEHYHNVYKGSSRTLLNEKICGVNDQERWGQRIVARAMGRKLKLQNQMPDMESQQNHDRQDTSAKKMKHQTRRKSKNEAAKVENVKGSPNNMVPDPEYLHLHRNVELQDKNLHDLKKQNDRKLKGTMKQKIGASNQVRGVENQHKHGRQSASVKKSVAQRKSRNEAYKVKNVKGLPNDMVQDSEYPLHKDVKLEDNNYVHMHKGDTAANEKINGVDDEKRPGQRKLTRDMEQRVGPSNQMPGVDNQRKHEVQTTSAKKTTRLTLGKSRNWFEKVDTVKYLPSKFRDAKCLMANKIIDGNNLEEGEDDVEILDSAAFFEEGISSPFVASKKFRRSEEEEGIQCLGRSSTYDEFRRQVLDVLRKPYDKEEYLEHQTRVRAGSYLDYHPDVGKKLKKYRYKRRKRLAILRGFFFWLQHLTREGAFKPWKDRECLAVEPEDQSETSSPEF
ncbi:hypothetical protein Salat_1261300 [Sesamum alatum]|uniref:Uncharacterized protein n=1 Tax=Sesamum alatum TaxID=300844 RepID=A0AAE1YGG6_9LAMI|nr:hypothetical protein Salat_1261300 [Sesamum alatum]